MSVVRRCLGCGSTYPLDEHACPKCGSHAAEVEKTEIGISPKAAAPKSKPARRRKT